MSNASVKTYEENTQNYKGIFEVKSSCLIKGMLLLQIFATDKNTLDESSAGIRLTREQARQLANDLLVLADQLYFEELRKLQKEGETK